MIISRDDVTWSASQKFFPKVQKIEHSVRYHIGDMITGLDLSKRPVFILNASNRKWTITYQTGRSIKLDGLFIGKVDFAKVDGNWSKWTVYEGSIARSYQPIIDDDESTWKAKKTENGRSTKVVGQKDKELGRHKILELNGLWKWTVLDQDSWWPIII